MRYLISVIVFGIVWINSLFCVPAANAFADHVRASQAPYIAGFTPALYLNPVARDITCPYTDIEFQRCKIVFVPESRNGLTDRSLGLYVQIFKAKDSSSDADPIVFLDGGPGASSARLLQSFNYYEELRETHDIIVVFQRGTARTTSAMCPGAGEGDVDEFYADMTFEDIGKSMEQKLSDCFAELSEMGGDIRAYTTQEIAADIRDIRIALNINTWNVWGSSYGTALAQALARIDGNAIRAAVLDGVVVVEDGWIGQTPINFRKSLDKLRDICQQQARCASAFPDVSALFTEAISSLRAKPLTLSKKSIMALDEFGKREVIETPLILNDHDLAVMVFALLYDSRSFSRIPIFLKSVLDRDRRLADLLITQSYDVGGSAYFDIGAFTAIGCQLNNYGDGLDIPEDGFHYIDNGKFQKLCSRLGLKANPVHPVSPSDFSFPVLLMSGKFDPVTPPENGERLATIIPGAHHIILQDQGHGGSFERCGFSILVNFIQAPSEKPAHLCAARKLDEKFPIKLFPTDEAEHFNADFELGLEFAIADVRYLFYLMGLSVILFFAHLNAYKRSERRVINATAATLLTTAVLFTIWLMATTHYSEHTYSSVFSANLGITPLGSKAFLWVTPFLWVGGISFVVMSLWPKIERASVGQSTIHLLTGLTLIWIGLHAVHAGFYPSAASEVFDPIKSNEKIQSWVFD